MGVAIPPNTKPLSILAINIMKIKLITPPTLQGIKGHSLFPNLFPSLGVATLVSYLKESSIKVEADDLNIKLFHANKKKPKIDLDIFQNYLTQVYLSKKKISFMDNEKLYEETEKIVSLSDFKSIDLVGISIENLDTGSAFLVELIAKFIKEEYGSKIVIGGEIRSKLDIYQNSPYIDFIVLDSEGEKTLKQLILKLEQQKQDLPKNQSYEAKPYVNRQQFNITQEGFICPDFLKLPLDLYKFKYDIPFAKKKKMLLLPYRFVKNCLFNCAFCAGSFSRRCVANDPLVVAEDLKMLKKRYHTEDFLFLNSNVNPTKKYIEQLIYSFKGNDLNVSWIDCANVLNLDKKSVQGLYEIGCKKIIAGVESFSPRMLKFINKPIQEKDLVNVLNEAYSIGVWVEFELIAGMPNEKAEDIKYTINSIRKYKGFVSKFHLNKFELKLSEFTKNPSKYCIKNIRINQDINATSQYTFDEDGGLKWPEKKVQIDKSYSLIDKEIPEGQKSGTILSFLYILNKFLRPKENFHEYLDLLNKYNSYEIKKLILSRD